MAEQFVQSSPRMLSGKPGRGGTDDPELNFGYKYLFTVTSPSMEGGFSTISGISEEIEVVDLRDGTDPFQIKKIRGQRQGGSITLGRGVVAQRDQLIRWFQKVKSNSVPYWSNVDIGTYSRMGAGERTPANIVSALQIINAWPSKYEIGDLDAGTSEIAVEMLTLAHEGLNYVKR